MLRTLALKGVYKSDQDDILRQFYFPALAIAKRYDRAVGYFSASSLSEAAQALTVFIRGDGRIRLIVGAFTAQSDVDAVREGLRLKEVSERLGAEMVDAVTGIDDELFQHRFKALAWLTAQGRLEIRVALRPNGIYHDKVGVITDEAGDAIVFSGSANESAAALLPTQNYESINVFPAWRPELADWHEPHRESFERLWDNRSPGTVVIDMPSALRENLLEVAASLDAPPDAEREAQIAARLKEQVEREASAAEADARRPHPPAAINGMPFQMREHQLQALRAWQANGYRGIFDLATGAGKTITAVYAAVQMAKGVPGLAVVVAAPYQSLADQWCEILEAFNIRPLQCYVSRDLWHDELQKRVLDMQGGSDVFQAIVVVNRTLRSPEFQSLLARMPKSRLLWVGDECHHHGSEALASSLPVNADYRIGLSATPMHYLDDERNARLKAYYGDVVFSYTLAQAINDKVLTPYNYYPVVVPLTAEEADEFISLSDDIARAFVREDRSSGPPSVALTALLMKRARVIGSAANKMTALQQTLAGRQPTPHALFYCGDGQVEVDGIEYVDGTDDNQSMRQIEAVSRLLDGLGWKVSRFTARESRRERELILEAFKTSAIDGLVAIKCLDEGIDVPACDTAYILASSRDPRQFIQRRGRILRRSPGKSIAHIHDYVVVLPEDAQDESGAARKLITAELKRVAEFSGLALNRNQAYAALRPVLTAYDLEHIL